jgi:hypothetical protein
MQMPIARSEVLRSPYVSENLLVNDCLQVSCVKHPKVKFAGRLFPFSTGTLVSLKGYIATIRLLSHDIRCGLTARISRFHRGGRGSIPRTGTLLLHFGRSSQPASFVFKSTARGL